jgi:hypothetical protein
MCDQAKEDVGELETYDVKFKWVGPGQAATILEAQLLLLKVPAAPARWQLHLAQARAHALPSCSSGHSSAACRCWPAACFSDILPCAV